jgi:hypothetical protein
MARIPKTTPSHIGDTKLEPTGKAGAGPTTDAAPDLQRRKDARWGAPAGPGGDLLPPPGDPDPGPLKVRDPDDPPPTSIFWDLPREMILLLKRSFRDRTEGRSDVAYAFCWHHSPKTPWEGLERIPDVDLNVLATLAIRINQIDRRIWGLIKHVKGLWSMADNPFDKPEMRNKHHGCIGMGVVWNDNKSAEQVLNLMTHNASISLARDKPLGAGEHQDTPSWNPKNAFRDDDCHTFRQLVPVATPGLHFCVTQPGKSPKHDDIHLDWQCPADGKDMDSSHKTDDDRTNTFGKCTYSTKESVVHWFQAMGNVGVPTAWFSFGNYQKRLKEVRAKVNAMQPRPNPDGGGIIDPPEKGKFLSRIDDIEINQGLNHFYQPDYETWKTRQAMRGELGEEELQKVVTKFNAQIEKLEEDVKPFS